MIVYDRTSNKRMLKLPRVSIVIVLVLLVFVFIFVLFCS